jgi:hypothetical protein
MAKRPNTIKCEIVKAPAGLVFAEGFTGRKSLYRDKLFLALQQDSVLRVAAGDIYQVNQFRAAARKARLKVVIAAAGDWLYIKPIQPTEGWKALLLLLREPRTMEELRAKKIPDLDLGTELAKMRSEGHAHVIKQRGLECWVLTEKGLDLVAA